MKEKISKKPVAHPLQIEVQRGGFKESLHLVHAVVTDSSGKLVKGWGNPDHLTFPRSAVKPLQAIPLILSGAEERFQMSTEELAMACSSHGAESAHLRVVSSWLERIGCGVKDLECGSHWPSHEESAHELSRAGSYPAALHNNCSGKHTGFLTLARQRQLDSKGYIHPDHPIQQEIRSILEYMMELDLRDAPVGIDGCSIPTWGVPLKAMAKGFARFVTGNQLTKEYQVACEKLRIAMVTEPYFVAGTDRHCTRVMKAFGGTVVCKTGAEGVFAAGIPELGLGVALKAQDGTKRAAEVALSHILHQLGVNPKDPDFSIEQPLYNRNQWKIGSVRPVA